MVQDYRESRHRRGFDSFTWNKEEFAALGVVQHVLS